MGIRQRHGHGHGLPGPWLLAALLACPAAAAPTTAPAADAAVLRESLGSGARDRALRELEADPRLDPLARAEGLATRRAPLRLGALEDEAAERPSGGEVARASSGSLPFQDDSELRRRFTAVSRNGLPLFPVRRGLLDGDLVFGVSRRGTLGVFLSPRGLE